MAFLLLPAFGYAGTFDFAVYATGTGCGAITISSKAYIDSFDSAAGSYAQTKRSSGANVGVAGNIALSGSATIYGSVYAPNPQVGLCSKGSPGISLSGGAAVTEGFKLLNPPITFPTLPPVNAGPQNLALTSDTSLVPGTYGDIAVSGGAKVTLSPGRYKINSLAMSGGSMLTLQPQGQVSIYVAGIRKLKPLNLSGGGIQNLSGIPANLSLIYGGTSPLSLSGGTSSYAVVYAPNAPVDISGGSDWFGAFIVRTLDDSGGVAIHFDRSLAGFPVITGKAIPAPNSAGWNNSDVTVSFSCSDPVLGIASCTPSTLVSVEGQNQIVKGTAVNSVGITASTSVRLSIDKTLPSIGAAIAPLPNPAGWNKSVATVTFVCADLLSGIDACPVPVTVLTEGANQTILGTARDRAGNTSTVSQTVNLDTTAPTLTITSPVSGAVVPLPSVTLSGTVSDLISGIGSVTCQGSPATISASTFTCVVPIVVGPNPIVVQASDAAGNIQQANMTVQGGVPTILSATPNSGQQGQTNLSVNITAQFTHFVQGTTTASFGAGITTAVPLVVNSATSATATLNIDPAALAGARDLTLTTGTEMATLVGGFTVSPGTPVLTQVNPNTGQQGRQSLSVNITGQFTHFVQGTTTVSFGAGIALASPLTVNSATLATAVLNIDPTTVTGARDVTLTTNAEVVTLNSGFTVASGTPVLTTVAPNTGQQGQNNLSVTISGNFTHFTTGSVVTFSGSGVTAGAPTTATATSLTVQVTIAANAPVGAQGIQVVTGAETVALANAFTIAAGTPVITQVNPNTGRQGQQNLLTTITGQFTHFAQATSQVSFGAGVTVNSVTVASAISLTADISIATTAAVGSRTVTLTTGTEVSSLSNGFTVQANQPPSITSLPQKVRNWVKQAPTGTPPDGRSTAGSNPQNYDAVNDRMMFFGGDQTGGLTVPPPLGDMWVLVNTSGFAGTPAWVPLTSGGSRPSGRANHSVVYAKQSNRLIIHGGLLKTAGNLSDLADTWVLTNANGLGGTPSWTRLPDIPLPRENHAAVYDANANRMVVFGGISVGMSANLNDVWVLADADGVGSPAWLQLSPNGTPPIPRESPGVAYDPATNRMIIFGGLKRTGTGLPYTNLNDVWILTNANGTGGTPQWIQLAASGTPPAGRYGQSLVYDSASNTVIAFAGIQENAPGGTTPVNIHFNDTWVLSNANGLGGTPAWIQLAPAGGPPIGRLHHAAGFSQGSNQMIVSMGRSDQGIFLNDVWVLTAPSVSATEGQVYSYQVQAVDPDTGDVLAYSLDVSPGGMTINATTGLIQWTPSANQVGSQTVTVRVRDTAGLFDTQNFAITVNPANQAPVVEAGASPLTITLPASVTLAGAAIDDGKPAGSLLTMSWSQVSGPGPVTFSSPTSSVPNVGGQPYPVTTSASFNLAGTYVLRLTASDSLLSSSDDVTVIVNSPAGVPAITSISPSAGLQGQSNLAVAITGQFTNFVQGTTQVSFGTGITVNSVTVANATNLTASVSIAANATIGARTVTVTTGTEVASLSNGFTVQANQPPSITSLPQKIRNWVKQAPTGTPPDGRRTAGSNPQNYDAVNDRMMFFGGDQTGGATVPPPLGDVWVLVNASGTAGNSAWVRLTPGGSIPSGRLNHSVVYAKQSNRLIIHGGLLKTVGDLADTWVLTNANGLGGTPSWTRLPDIPLPRENHAAVYDANSNRMVVFGGISVGMGVNLNDVWVLADADGVGSPAWLQLSPGGTPPIPRESLGVAYDPATNRMIIFGGLKRTGTGLPYTHLNDVWVLTNANGTGGTPQWIQLSPNGTSPAGRFGQSLVYDTASNTAIAFAGIQQTPTNVSFNDTWVLSNANGLGGTSAWTQLAPAGGPPLGRFNHAAGFSQGSNQMTVSMGRSDQGPLPPPTEFFPNDVWVLTAPSASATEGQPYSYLVQAVDPDAADVLAYSLDVSPGGMTINATTGLIQWTPSANQVGSQTVTVRVRDTGGLFDTQSFTITVNPANQAPVVEAGVSPLTITLPAGLTLAGAAIDDGKPAGSLLTMSWSQVSGPGSVTFGSPTSSVPNVGGQPYPVTTSASFNLAGTYVLRLTASDSLLTGSDDVTLTVNSASGVPAITLVNPDAGQQGQANLAVALTGQFTNFVQGTSQVTFGAGVTVNSVAVSNASSLIANISIAANATVGARTVMVTTGTEIASLANGFAVVTSGNQAPTVSAGADQTATIQPQVTFVEYPGPTTPAFQSGNALVDITSGPDGNLWFTENYASGAQTQIGRITPAGVMTLFSVPSGSSEGGITAGPDGNLWFTEYRTQKIGRVTPAGVFTEFPIAGSFPSAITVGSDGNLWFTTKFGNTIGRITTAGVVTEFAVPTGNSQPNLIAAGPDGNLWFTEESGNKIGRITTAGVITEFPVPTGGSNPGGIAAGPDGNLWFVESTGNKIGRITPSGVIMEFPVPTSGAKPWYIAKGPDGNLWFTEGDGNKIGRITIAGVITEFPVPTSGSIPYGITTGPDGNLWFLELHGNKIVKVNTAIVYPPASTSLTGMLTDDGLPAGATLTASWSVTSGPGLVSFNNPTVTFPDVAGQANPVVTAASFPVPGTYTLKLTGSDTQLSGSSSVTVTVNAVRVPILLSVTPNTGQQGQQNFSVTITGQFTNFVQGTTQVSFGAGITVNSVTVASATSLTANISIAANAAASPRTVTVTTGAEIASSSGFTVSVVNQPPVVSASAGCDQTISLLPSQISIAEYPVATVANGLKGITLGPDCNLWVTDYFGDKIWRITLAGAMTAFSVSSGSGPNFQITVGPDGNLWFPEYSGKIGRITPAGVITEFPVPTNNSLPYGITAGPDGNLWFTEYNGDKVGRITPAGVITEFPIPTVISNLEGITSGPDGNLWFVEATGNKIGRITTAGVVTEFPIPTASSNPAGIAAGPDGNLWFTEVFGNKIGRITPAGTITEYPIPTSNSLPALITAGPDGNLWFAENGGNKIGRITTAGAMTEFPVPTPNSVVLGITAGPGGNLWFTENNGKSVAKINAFTSVAFGQLRGTVTDDGVPAGATLGATWSQISGLGSVSFGNPTVTFPDVAGQANPVVTTASFTVPGTYTLKLTGSDSQLSGSSSVTVTVNPAQIPTILSVNPNTAQPGQANMNVAITGQFTNFVQGTTQVSFGAGITVNSVTVTSATSLTGGIL